MKKALKLSVAILSVSTLTGLAHAATPGSYVGLGIGASGLKTPDNHLFSPIAGKTSRKQDGLGGRVFGGYNFNQYVGLEAGYGLYAPSTYKGSQLGANASTKYKANALDLVAKGYIPLAQSGFNLYGLGGLAYVSNTVEYRNNGVPLASGVTAPKVGSTTYHKVRPMVGIGTSYDIPQTQLTTSLELSHIQGSGNVKSSLSAIPSANMITLNLAYNFG